MKTIPIATNFLLAKSKVLLIEDSLLQQKIVKKYIEATGCNVTIAQSMQEGISEVESLSYDLIVTDMQLPDGLGVQIIEYARTNAKSKNRETPIIGASMNAEDFEQACYEAGVSEMERKPLSSEKISSWVKNYIMKKP